MKYLYSIFLLMGGLSLSIGQNISTNKSSVLPNVMPNPIVWAVTYTYPDELGYQAGKASLTGRTRSIETSIVGKTTHIVISRIESPGEDLWKTGTEEYNKASNIKSWSVVETKYVATHDESISTTFPGSSWINSKCFLGSTRIDDKVVAVYAINCPPNLDTSDLAGLVQNSRQLSYLALIDTENKLPIEIHEGGVKEVFTYAHPPAVLSLPSDLITQIQQGARVRQSVSFGFKAPY